MGNVDRGWGEDKVADPFLTEHAHKRLKSFICTWAWRLFMGN